MKISSSNLKPKFFLIEKSNFLSKKRDISITDKESLNTPTSPNEKLLQSDTFTYDKHNIVESSNNSNNTITSNCPILKKAKWSEEEDFILMKYVNKYGEGKWNKISNFLLGRTRKQIRQRYISNIKIKKITEEKIQKKPCDSSCSSSEEEDNVEEKQKINQTIVFKWTEELDKILLKEYFLNKKSWVKISRKIPGSSENSVKNRFYSLLRQKVNKTKKDYKKRNMNKPISNTKNENQVSEKLFFLIQREIYGNNKINNNIEDTKEILFNNIHCDSDIYSSHSKKKNYSRGILLEFLPELLEEKGINIYEILKELNERKNKAAKQLFIIIEKHFDCNKDTESNEDYKSISTDIEISNLRAEQSEKLGNVIKNMKLKIMYKYFHRFRYNTLGI